MKHGAGFRKLSKKTSHRLLMLRNLVTSLLEHEQIKTTLPKARETARLAEKIITLGKNGDEPSFRRATAFVLKPQMVQKIFTTFRERYTTRPGGYTRIHKFGNRPGDNAPTAILELVDNPRDLKMEVTAKAVGWDLLAQKLHKDAGDGVQSIDANETINSVRRVALDTSFKGGPLRELTKRNLNKVVKFRGEDGILEVGERARKHMAHLLAEPQAYKGLRHNVGTSENDGRNPYAGRIVQAGRRLTGMPLSATGLRLAQGSLGKKPLHSSQFWEKRTKLGVRSDSIKHIDF